MHRAAATSQTASCKGLLSRNLHSHTLPVLPEPKAGATGVVVSIPAGCLQAVIGRSVQSSPFLTVISIRAAVQLDEELEQF